MSSAIDTRQLEIPQKSFMKVWEQVPLLPFLNAYSQVSSLLARKLFSFVNPIVHLFLGRVPAPMNETIRWSQCSTGFLAVFVAIEASLGLLALLLDAILPTFFRAHPRLSSIYRDVVHLRFVEVWSTSSVILLGDSWSGIKTCISPGMVRDQDLYISWYGPGPYDGAPIDPQSGIEW